MTRARPILRFLFLTLLASLAGAWSSASGPPQQAGSARQLLQRAVHLEEAMGDPEAAIATYEMVIAAADADAPLTAVAEFRLATLLTAMGRGDEARAHYLAISQRFADVPRLAELVALSRAALGEDSTARVDRTMVARLLWGGADTNAFGALSPDGSFISFVDWASGNLAIHDLDRDSERFVADLSDVLDHDAWSTSAVSPSGDRIAYTWYSKSGGYEIRTIARDGTQPRTILVGWHRPRHVELEGWSADGRFLLAIVDIDESTHELSLIDTRDGSVRTVTALGSTAPELARLSPDGRWIAYHQVNEAGLHDVLLAATDGSITTKLVDHPANDLLPIWTADGRYVLFVSDRTGALGAWIVEVSNRGQPVGEARLVKADFGRSIPMGFTDHGALIYAQQVSLNDIYTAPLNPEDGTLGGRIAIGGRLVGVNRSPTLSPDGSRMAYVSERGLLPADLGARVLTIRDMGSGREHSPTTQLRRTLAPRWHPDGHHLVAEGLAFDDRWGVYTIDTDGDPEHAQIEMLAGWTDATCGCSASPVVSPDGSLLAYFRPYRQEGLGDLVVRVLATGQETVLVGGATPRDIVDMDFSPDGRRLATALRMRGADGLGSWHLQFIDVVTGERRHVTSLGTNYEVLTLSGWTDGGEGILFVRAEDDLHSLGWASADGRDQVWLILDLPQDIREVTLHPRYDRLVFTAGEYRAEVWMLENPLAALDENR